MLPRALAPWSEECLKIQILLQVIVLYGTRGEALLNYC